MKKRMLVFLWVWPSVAFILGIALIDQEVINPAYGIYMAVLWMVFTALSWVVNKLLNK